MKYFFRPRLGRSSPGASQPLGWYGKLHTNPKRQRGRRNITPLTLRISGGSFITGRPQHNHVENAGYDRYDFGIGPATSDLAARPID